MANFLTTDKFLVVLASTAAGGGSTGGVSPQASTLSGTTTLVSGFPFSSTGVDTSGYDGITFAALVSNSSQFQLAVSWNAVSSTVSATGFTQYSSGAIASGSGASTDFDSIAINVTKPVKRYAIATAYVPTSSAVCEGIIAILHRASVQPTASASTAYLVSNSAIVAGTT